MNFSVVCIARNEAKTLPRLVESLKEFQENGGEIVILDTGSTDGTQDVARGLGCNVFEIDLFHQEISPSMVEELNKYDLDGQPIVAAGEKIFDFAAARNYAAQLASNDWIFMPDCDEVLTKFDLDQIAIALQTDADQIDYNFVFAHDPYGRELVKFKHCKFYNRRTAKWYGMVHEVVIGSQRRVFCGESVIKLEHWQNRETRRGNYLSGLALGYHQNPDNDRLAHYFGRELYGTGRYKSAIPILEKHVEMNCWTTERSVSAYYIGDCYKELGDEKNALAWYHRSTDIDCSRREAWMRLAEHYYKKDDKQRTACYVAAALEIPHSTHYANTQFHYTYRPHELMYWAKWWLGDREGSKEHFLKALRFFPENPKFREEAKFYYEYTDKGIEGWMSLQELNFLYEASKEMSSVAEIGSWKGRSTDAILNGCKGTVLAIDTFEGSPGEAAHKGISKDSLYAEFMCNVGKYKNLEVFVGKSEDAPKKEYDMVFIDGGHTYEDVKKDIEIWKPHAKKLICGHDYCKEWPGVVKAVNESFGEVSVNGTIWYKYL